MIKKLDSFLNSITMYRLMVYGLFVILIWSLWGAWSGSLPYSEKQIVLSTGFLYLICTAENWILAKIFRVQTNLESTLITVLILALIMAPATKMADWSGLWLVGTLAIASKYFLTIKKKHLFNPVAIAVLILNVLGWKSVVWWVGSPVMLSAVLTVGFLVTRKLKREKMVGAFLGALFLSVSISGWRQGINLMEIYQQVFTSWPVFFLGTIMLTEPLTSPTQIREQMIYGAMVGFLAGTSFKIGRIFSTPELALVAGNLLAYAVNTKVKIALTLKTKEKLSPNIYELSFMPDQKMAFEAGQYLEWTLSHKKPDSRGTRRYFTIASSPTEKEIKLDIRYEKDRPSSFKKALLKMKPGEVLTASQLAGEFVLPKDKKAKLAFIAGGIGIAPFRSMIKYLLDKDEKRDMTLFYMNKVKEDIVHEELLAQAEKIGLKTVYILTETENILLTWKGRSGRLDQKILTEESPDYRERVFYLSGPNSMVSAEKQMLLDMGVRKQQVITDYFPGY